MITAKVNLWGQYVGALVEDGNQVSFEYDKTYLSKGHSISPVNLPLKDQIFSFPELTRKEAFLGLPGVFADCLPDSFGNKIIEKVLKDRGLNALSQVQKLLYVGRRGMGALEFEPATSHSESERLPLEISQLVKESRKVLQGDITTKTAEIMQVGSTAGGMRAKAVVGWNKKKNEVVHGLGDLPADFQHWIFKFDGVQGKHEPWCTLEYIYMRLSKKAGIKTPEVHLFGHKGLQHFMVKRFDRAKGKKIHMHTLGGLIHSDYNTVGEIDYKNFFSIAKSIGCTAKDIEDLYKRMIFNILANNHDDHVKNFSFLMDSDGNWQPSPAYDVTYITGGKWTEGHQITCNAKDKEITWHDMEEVANDCSIRNPLDLAKEVVEALSGFDAEAKKAALDSVTLKKVKSDLKLDLIPKSRKR
jgi:serine/threonine-protein kinase HipA